MPTNNHNFYVNIAAQTAQANELARLVAEREQWFMNHPAFAHATVNGYDMYIAAPNPAVEYTAHYADTTAVSLFIVRHAGTPQERHEYLGIHYGYTNQGYRDILTFAEQTVSAVRPGAGQEILSADMPHGGGSANTCIHWEWVGNLADNFIAGPMSTFYLTPFVPMRYCLVDMAQHPETDVVLCDCGSWICNDHRDSDVHLHDGDYCNDCGFNVTSGTNVDFCGECSDYYCSSHSMYHEHEEEPYYDSDDEPSGYHDDYSGRRPRIRNFGREATLVWLDSEYTEHEILRQTRAAALEIEVEYTRGDPITTDVMKLPEGVGIGNDGSLNNGIEITLPPMKGAMLADYLGEVCDTLHEFGFGDEESCGMHAHIDLRDKVDDKRFLAHLFNAMFSCEDILFAMQTTPRAEGEYSLPLRGQYKFYEMYGQEVDSFDFNFYRQSKNANGKREMDGEKGRKYAAPRYASFNFHSIYYRGSLECRIHEGCSDANEALKWVELLQRIISRVEKGHSYEFMRRMANQKVTQVKFAAFCRYFKIPKDIRVWMFERIQRGQGWNYDLGPFKWGSPKKGRAKNIVDIQPVHHVNQMVQCDRCDHQFTMRRSLERCPNCNRRLFDSYGSIWYRLFVPPLPDFNWQTLSNTYSNTGQAFQAYDALDLSDPSDPEEF